MKGSKKNIIGNVLGNTRRSSLMVKHAPEERMKTVRFCPAAHYVPRSSTGTKWDKNKKNPSCVLFVFGVVPNFLYWFVVLVGFGVCFRLMNRIRRVVGWRVDRV